MNQALLEKYAALAIRKGVNVQKNQTLIIQANIEAYEMVRLCVKEAYEVGAKQVVVHYYDDITSRYDYLYQDDETLGKVYKWQVDCKLDYFKEGACILHIISDIPEVLNGIDAKKIAKASLAKQVALKEVRNYTMSNEAAWSIIACPNPRWAKKVFPDLSENEAMDALWKAIFKSVLVDEMHDVLALWDEKQANFEKRLKIMNDNQFDYLHFTNQLGTDLKVGLVKNHLWGGGCDFTHNNVAFNANIPTEEIFCMPNRLDVNGIVYASLPLDYNGVLIKDFWIRFADGKAVDFDAKEGKDTLRELIELDEGSAYLGEVALVPYNSAISMMKILFYNTLFDENASCHLALGEAYPMNLQGGIKMSEDELKAHGANISHAHVDFMFGTADMQVVGFKGCFKTMIFENGNFVF